MVAWFYRTPGSDFLISEEEEGMFLLDAGPPDWVNVPAEVGEGSGQRRCLGFHVGPCPIHDHTVRHFDLEGPIQVAECPKSGFLWYRKREHHETG